MQNKQVNTQDIELTREITFPGDISFDLETVTLHGSYADQLSAYRARKIWVSTLENCFLLEQGQDFVVSIRSNLTDGNFGIICSFISACARYAFWRLTNNQAPEAQYMIETAHIPDSEMRHDDYVAAPDMRPQEEDSLPLARQRKDTLLERIGTALAKLVRESRM